VSPREAPEREVPVERLVDLGELRARKGRDPTPSELRAALPRGWVLQADGRTARRDLRLFFREGWILLVGLVVFGGAGALFLTDAMPRGPAGLLRLAVLIASLALAGGVVGPLVTRALRRRG